MRIQCQGLPDSGLRLVDWDRFKNKFKNLAYGHINNCTNTHKYTHPRAYNHRHTYKYKSKYTHDRMQSNWHKRKWPMSRCASKVFSFLGPSRTGCHLRSRTTTVVVESLTIGIPPGGPCTCTPPFPPGSRLSAGDSRSLITERDRWTRWSDPHIT